MLISQHHLFFKSNFKMTKTIKNKISIKNTTNSNNLDDYISNLPKFIKIQNLLNFQISRDW
ncbi:hypothetical protein NUACC26_037000 [Scytonema sp. NUACC26]